MMTRIPFSEIRFHPHSFFEPGIRLFQWNGQLYRGISSERASFFKELFETGIIKTLTERRLLVDSELTPLAVDGYEMVVHHRRIPFPSYPNEWCAAMLKDGALTIIDLAIELAHHGLALGDAHPWNLLFDIESGKPIFVDLGSIVSIADFTWSAYDEFCRFCLHPLILMVHGEDQIARLLMCEDSGVMESDISKLIGDTVLPGSRPHRRDAQHEPWRHGDRAARHDQQRGTVLRQQAGCLVNGSGQVISFYGHINTSSLLIKKGQRNGRAPPHRPVS